MLPKYYEDPSTLHVGTMPLRADYCPQGACRLSLNGTWDFRYFTRAEDVPEDIAAQRWQSAATIPVPSVWQAHGYDAYFYSDERYPFPYDPPYAPGKFLRRVSAGVFLAPGGGKMLPEL